MLTFEYYDYTFGLQSDSRIRRIVPDPSLLGEVWLCASLVMAGFGAAYLALRRPRMMRLERLPSGAVVALWLGLSIAVAVNLFGYFSRGGGDAYLEEYLLFRDLPLWLVQLLNALFMMFQVSAFGLFAYYMTTGRRFFAAAILVASLAFFLMTTGARSMLVVVGGGYFILHDHLVKRFSPFILGSLAATGLVAFLALGLIRDGTFALSDVAGRNEFISVFVTALDIQQLYITGSTLDMNVNLLISDLLRLVPQQLLGFTKVDPATWYVSNFYPIYAESGGGMAFGIVSEAVLSGGGLSALARGLALGVVLCLALNFLTRRATIWRLLIYTWLFINLYLSFRDTTFTLLGRFAFQVAPGLLLIFVVSHLLSLRGAGSAQRARRRGEGG